MGYFLIVFGSFLASSSLAFAWWVKVREISLRQAIYDERDCLFDAARELQAFDDPAYRSAREHLNSLADCVDFVTIPILAYVSAKGHSGRAHGLVEKTDNAELSQAIRRCFSNCEQILAKYLLHHTATGICLLTAVKVNRLRDVLEKYAAHLCHRWIYSLVPGECDRVNATSCTAIN